MTSYVVVASNDEVTEVIGVYGVWDDERGANEGAKWLAGLPGMSDNTSFKPFPLRDLNERE